MSARSDDAGAGAGAAGSGSCDEHGQVGEELRLLALALLDRFEPRVQSVLAGLRVEASEAAAAGASPSTASSASSVPACEWCPLCSLIALARGDRPELAGKVAEHAGGLLVALRAVLQSPPGSTPPGSTPPPGPSGSSSGPPRVQRIEVDRADPGAGGGC